MDDDAIRTTKYPAMGLPLWIRNHAGEVHAELARYVLVRSDQNLGILSTTVRRIARALGYSDEQVKTALRVLKESHFLDWEPLRENSKEMVITIANYAWQEYKK